MKTGRLRSRSHVAGASANGPSSTKAPDHELIVNEVSSSACEKEQSKKHQVTPLKKNDKHSKTNCNEDVHSFCTTPKSRFGRIVLPDVPRFSNPYHLEENQDDLPEITWDFDSPKTEKDLQEAAKSMTIAHLLANLNRFCEDDPKRGQPSGNSSLAVIDSKENIRETTSVVGKANATGMNQSPVFEENQFQLPSPVDYKKYQRRRWRRPNPKKTEEVLEILKSLSGEGKGKCGNTKENHRILASVEGYNQMQRAKALQENLEKSTSHLQGNSGSLSTENLDSLEDMWGEDEGNDDNLIVKATQEFETHLINSLQKSVSQNASSYIPETFAQGSEVNKNYSSICTDILTEPGRSSTVEHSADISRTLKFTPIKFRQSPSRELKNRNEILKDVNDLLVLNTDEWDSVLDDDDWYHDFLDTSSKKTKVSDHQGTDVVADVRSHKRIEYSCAMKEHVYQTAKENSLRLPSMIPKSDDKNTSKISMFSTNVSDNFACARSSTKSRETDAEIEFFNDELNDPEVLTWLDKIESQSSAPKCCDEEIALKREAALKRLRDRTRSKDFLN